MANKKNTKGNAGKKGSVKQRKKSEATAVQNYIPIAEVKQDALVLKNGGVRAVLSVESMNFSLKSEDEQQAIVVSYQQFLNTLTFPIQIVVRSTKLNVDAYIADLNGRADKQTNPLLKEQTLDYARFIERMIDVSDIMQKRFYVVVPADSPGGSKISFLQKYLSWLSPADSRTKAVSRGKQFEGAVAKLRDRVNIVTAGLESVGLPTERLSTSNLIELFYQVYNPKTSQEQKIKDASDLNVKEYVL